MRRVAVLGAVLIALALVAGSMGVFRRSPASPVAPAANADRERAYRSNNLGVALLERFNYEGAAGAFREALRIDPGVAIARLNLSIALYYLPDLEGAAREATAAASLLPSAPQPPYVLGLIARADNRDEDAMRFFERVRQMDPADVGTAINLAQILLQGRNYSEAIATLRPLVFDEPYNVTATYNLGLALSRAGQAEEGRRLMERSQVVRDSGYGTTLSNGYMEQGRYAEGVASTGAEPELVDGATPPAGFTPAPPLGVAATGDVTTSPFGRQYAPADLSDEGLRGIAAGLGGGLTLADIDRNGSLDLIVVSSGGQRVWRNDGRGAFTDVTSESGLAAAPAGAVGLGCVAADVDNDGLPDLFVLRYGASSLYHNDGNGHFSDVTARAGLAPYPSLPGAAALADIDHDGDLDIAIAGLADLRGSRALGRTLTFPDDFAAAPMQLHRNNGDGTFSDITRQAGFDALTRAMAILPTDFDNRRDIDLLIVNRTGAPLLFKNQRDGTFHNAAQDTGLAAAVRDGDRITSVATGDTNKDDAPDFVIGRAGAPSVLIRSDGRGRFTAETIEGTGDAVASQVFDYDNDGLLDVVSWSATGPRVIRNAGSRWVDVTPAATAGVAPSAEAVPLSSRMLAAADVNGDGAADMLAGSRGGSVTVWRNSGDARNAFLRVALRGRVSNRSGAGAKVQVRAGSLIARLETSASTPAAAPAGVLFGLGRRPGADVVRVLWPSGVLQAEFPVTQEITIEELDRKPSSCPFLYTWNGERFEFVTDFMGGGELGAWQPPGPASRPDPVEYVRIRGDQLRAKDGRYEIRVTNELEETLFVDRLQLLSVAHPIGVGVFPNEGMTVPPKPFRLYAVTDQASPVSAVDDHGHVVTAKLAHVDRQYPDDFQLKAFRGYADDHTLTLDLGAVTGPSVLLMTGWTDYAFSSDNLAAHQAGLALLPPALEVKDAAGKWRTAIADIGIPVGRPQTIVADLSTVLRPGEHEVRIRTNMRIYWDRIAVARLASSPEPASSVGVLAARLHERGFSLPLKPDGKEPETYDYSRVTARSPWKTMAGRFTRAGDVAQLLAGADDMFVISKPGDEITLSFDAATDAALPAGWTRTFLLMSDGFSKEMDINSASPDRVEPLPFHAMTRYPPPAEQRYPDSAAHRDYRERYNSRAWWPLLHPTTQSPRGGGPGLPPIIKKN
ncbi:MAG: FG-GAP-like repeat-containing protein [Acidobacteriota bacterium]|nr:FG-GAP-like repeat-containing protein [Acidobacteriota bacterium]